MAESTRRTWSQQQLAHLARLTKPPETGWLTADKRALLLLASKTAFAAGVCYGIAQLAGLQDGYWGSISAIIVLQSNVGSTVNASRDRLLGTLIGAAVGALFLLAGAGLWIYLLAVVVAMVTCSLLGLKNSSRLAGVTVTILMLVHRPQPGTSVDWTLPLHRVLEVMLGIVVALAISALVLPSRARARLRDGLAQEYLLLGSVFQAIMTDFRSPAAKADDAVSGSSPAHSLSRLWKEADASIEANTQLLDAARNEPSTGPASLEGLSLLHQFGRALKDLMHALSLAVEGSGEDGYAVHLEPELGKLSADIYKGFQFVAGCIHRWEFDKAPEGFLLEADIAALESRMAAIRPTGLEFPQNEILRAYAVQLHLKQLARLLRSARIETSQAIG
jgi:uncharacterized membrane protein YccC